jgi:hypothetical protein
MLTYISIILTIHTLFGIYSVVSTEIIQKRHFKMIQAEIDERNKFFTELGAELKESEVGKDG